MFFTLPHDYLMRLLLSRCPFKGYATPLDYGPPPRHFHLAFSRYKLILDQDETDQLE